MTQRRESSMTNTARMVSMVESMYRRNSTKHLRALSDCMTHSWAIISFLGNDNLIISMY